MGMFYNKLVESAVEDVIQTPDDIGVDLDAVEKAIVGEDGCEAHRDEIDDAMSGVVGDPLEEASYIMYESEYNLNLLMKNIGMTELNEASSGRDFILEGGNMAAFLDRAKEVLTKMFGAITKAFAAVMQKLKDAVDVDKKLLKRLNDIEYGYANAEWEFKDVYDFNALKRTFDFDMNASGVITDMNANIADAGKIPTHADIVNKLSGINASGEAPEVFMIKALEDKHFVKITYSNNGSKPNLEDVTAVLKDNGIDALKKKHGEIKKAYGRAIKSIEYLKKSTYIADPTTKVKNDDGVSVDANFAAMIGALTYEKNVQNKLFALTMRATKTRHTEAVHMCKAWANMGAKLKSKASGKKEPKVEVQNNSTLFNVNLI